MVWWNVHFHVGNYNIQDIVICREEREETIKMIQSIVQIAIVVKDYDEAIEFYTKKLHFTLVEDTYQPEQDKRWVVVAPPGSYGTTILLARASKPIQESFNENHPMAKRVQ